MATVLHDFDPGADLTKLQLVIQRPAAAATHLTIILRNALASICLKLTAAPALAGVGGRREDCGGGHARRVVGGEEGRRARVRGAVVPRELCRGGPKGWRDDLISWARLMAPNDRPEQSANSHCCRPVARVFTTE